MTPPVGAIGAAAATPVSAGTSPVRPGEEAEGFERLLLGQLTRTLVDSALGDAQSPSAATTAYRDMLPDALTEALMSGGGIGLARALEDGLER